ncbi:MAG: tryptophan synthase subunit alpha [Armatimonadaceae bacterium]
MSRLQSCFDSLRSKNEAALVVFVTAGDPFPGETWKVIKTIADAGADVIELGIPFSDPLADGPVIQASSMRALIAGVTPPSVLEDVRAARAAGVTVPIVLMGSWNPVMQFGSTKFAKAAADAGADATILTDLSPDEADEWKEASAAAGLDTIFLLAPTSTQVRMDKVKPLAGGFIYCVSRTGITGMHDNVSSGVAELVETIRGNIPNVPVCVGFGISQPEHVRAVAQVADGAVVGSRIVQQLHETQSLDVLSETVASLKAATKR